MNEKQIDLGLKMLELEFGAERVNKAREAVRKFKVEIPSWVFGEFGGGRFGDYMPPGCARNIFEKLDDAALVHKLTGATESVATHVLWDLTDDGIRGSYEIAERVNIEAGNRGLQLGSINPTYFLRGSHRGSLSASEKSTTRDYVEQTLFADTIAHDFGCGLVVLWLPDGSLYPGQVDLRAAFAQLKASLQDIASGVHDDSRVLIEYKVFEPGTYSTVIADWGAAFALARAFGDKAGVLVDMGHHHHTVNIEQIVAQLVDEGMYGGFHFNTRYAADDDHAVEPNAAMARIFCELVSGGVIGNADPRQDWAYMVDQCSSRENRMQALLHTVDSLQLSLAKATLLNREVLSRYQDSDEIIRANRTLNDALLNADVRPVVASVRLEKNLPVDPVVAYVESGYQARIEEERN
jgi:L-rhamnose isomerase/sugar isomerase